MPAKIDLAVEMVKKKQENFKQKIQELKKAVRDGLFLDDLNEISKDFRPVDLSGWEEDG